MTQEMVGFWDAVASAGPYANNLHLDPDRQPHPTSHHSIFTDWMFFLTPNQQCQSTEVNVEQIAAVLTANSFVTAATYRVRLKISTYTLQWVGWFVRSSVDD